MVDGGDTVVTVGCWLRWLRLCLFGLISGLGFVVWCLRSLCHALFGGLVCVF